MRDATVFLRQGKWRAGTLDTGRVLCSGVSVAAIQLWSWLLEPKEEKWILKAERCLSFISSGTRETANLPRTALDVFVLSDALLRGIVCGQWMEAEPYPVCS